ncbi:NAD(P)/FAD-dependent oxidoreductase [Pelosinus sp. sgz500959]|uniref:NAD(P)/FAD-dependent oxidoreductase n=1 Tax=Pelosinus sp. sgz500959 TaxID=3242472 RepID=UPI0036713B53
MLRVINMRVSLNDNTSIHNLAAKRLRIPPQAVLGVVIIRKALDARRKNNISFVYSLDVKTTVPEGQLLSSLRGDKDVTIIKEQESVKITPREIKLEDRPVVIGLGPAGMLAALTLAQHGYRPLVLERGRDVEKRTQDIAKFWNTGEFDETSNVQFGEGGAGTFSDGKLTTRVNDPLMHHVLDLFVKAGAPPEIMYLHKPHIGTDKLRGVVKKIREQIIELGGQVEFEAKVTDVTIENGKIKGVTVNDNRYIPCSIALFAIGHSARDTYTMLYNRGIDMEAKPFAIGVRIEHPQELIDQSQYGISASHPNLSAADYSLVYHAKETRRTAYSFCMCPGGLVVAAASEIGGVVTNGMSLYNRASGVSNSALVVNVNPEDFGSDVLAGIDFQRKYEQLAFKYGGNNYHAPLQTVGDFLANKVGSTAFQTKPSYRPGVCTADLRQCLPDFVTDTLAEALPDFDRKIKGFAHPDAIMTGVETRTSAPVRIKRNHEYMSVNVQGFYPIGEGAGYAGGIMSAALDGLNSAIAIIKTI